MSKFTIFALGVIVGLTSAWALEDGFNITATHTRDGGTTITTSSNDEATALPAAPLTEVLNLNEYTFTSPNGEVKVTRKVDPLSTGEQLCYNFGPHGKLCVDDASMDAAAQPAAPQDGMFINGDIFYDKAFQVLLRYRAQPVQVPLHGSEAMGTITFYDVKQAPISDLSVVTRNTLSTLTAADADTQTLAPVWNIFTSPDGKITLRRVVDPFSTTPQVCYITPPKAGRTQCTEDNDFILGALDTVNRNRILRTGGAGPDNTWIDNTIFHDRDMGVLVRVTDNRVEITPVRSLSPALRKALDNQ